MKTTKNTPAVGTYGPTNSLNMKSKFKPRCQIVPMPNTDRYMVQSQYNAGGAIYTDTKDGKGYDLDSPEDQALLEVHRSAFRDKEGGA